jgi:anti-anti-sigma regulatory factor
MDQDVLQISTVDRGDVTIVQLSGELDSINVGDLTNAFNAILHQGKRLFVLDLGAIRCFGIAMRARPER